MQSAINIRMQELLCFAFGLKSVLNDAACNKVLDVLRACNAVDDVSWPAASSRVARRDLHKAPAIFCRLTRLRHCCGRLKTQFHVERSSIKMH